MGKALLKTFYQSYPDSTLFSSRCKQKAQEVIGALGLPLEAVSTEEALKADIVIPTLWFSDLLPLGWKKIKSS